MGFTVQVQQVVLLVVPTVLGKHFELFVGLL